MPAKRWHQQTNKQTTLPTVKDRWGTALPCSGGARRTYKYGKFAVTPRSLRRCFPVILPPRNGGCWCLLVEWKKFLHIIGSFFSRLSSETFPLWLRSAYAKAIPNTLEVEGFCRAFASIDWKGRKDLEKKKWGTKILGRWKKFMTLLAIEIGGVSPLPYVVVGVPVWWKRYGTWEYIKNSMKP